MQLIDGARMCSDDRVAPEFEGSGRRDRARVEGKAHFIAQRLEGRTLADAA